MSMRDVQERGIGEGLGEEGNVTFLFFGCPASGCRGLEWAHDKFLAKEEEAITPQ